MQSIVGIGLLGCGTVGREVATRLLAERDALILRSGVRYELRGIAVRERAKARTVDARFTHDVRALLDDPAVDLIVECIGGIDDATEYVEHALERGRSVVSANKDLLANHGPRLRALAASRGAGLRYEAAVGGAIPVLRALEESLAGDRITACAGVLNGTCNAILGAMESGSDYAAALADAQRCGFAERDARNDVDGHDTAHKLAVLAQVAFRLAIVSPRIARTGIAEVSKRDIARAQMLGFRIRLVAAAVRSEHGALTDVEPILVRADHPFAQISGADNVVVINARDAGSLLLRGAGAGGAATASAVVGDIVASLRAIAQRHDLRYADRLAPARDVAPLFAHLPRHPELPRYRVWNQTLLDAPISHASRALS